MDARAAVELLRAKGVEVTHCANDDEFRAALVGHRSIAWHFLLQHPAAGAPPFDADRVIQDAKDFAAEENLALLGKCVVVLHQEEDRDWSVLHVHFPCVSKTHAL